MSSDKATSWSYCDDVCVEDDLLYAARARATELDVPTLSPAAGRLVTTLTAAIDAKAVVEVGTGAGVGGLFLLRAMSDQGTLTSVDAELENQHLAREVFAADQIRSARTRLISGRPEDVLSRLAAGAYDVVLLNCFPWELAACASQALRLLRRRGLLIINGMLHGDRVANPARRDEETVAVREVAHALLEDERLDASLIPVGDGLLIATRR